MLASIHELKTIRSAAIRRYDPGDSADVGGFDGIVELAGQICQCSVAMVSILREGDQRFEALRGIDADLASAIAAIADHTLLQDEILEIPDLRLDMRTRHNPLVEAEDAPILFYAGVQIVTRGGVPLGALCVMDTRPRRLGDTERRALRILAEQVMQRLELHDLLRQQDAMRREVDHRVKNSLANVVAMARMAARKAAPEARAALTSVEQRISVMVELHQDLYRADDPDAPIDVDDYIKRITSHLREMAPGGIDIEVHCAPLALMARRASALGVLVNEMVANACKHGFPDGRTGHVYLRGRLAEDGHYVLTCEDDGVGADTPATAAGIGMRIMEASAAQLEGHLSSESTDAGFRVEVEFPTVIKH